MTNPLAPQGDDATKTQQDKTEFSDVADALKEIQQQMQRNEEAYQASLRQNNGEKQLNANAKAQYGQYVPDFQKDPSLKDDFVQNTAKTANHSDNYQERMQAHNTTLKNIFSKARENLEKHAAKKASAAKDESLQEFYQEMAQYEKSNPSYKHDQEELTSSCENWATAKGAFQEKNSEMNFNPALQQFFNAQNQFQETQQQNLNQKLEELDNLLITEYRDRQIKHKHLLEFLEKHNNTMQIIRKQIEFLAQEQGTKADFETLFINKLQEVMERSEQKIAQSSENQLEILTQHFALAERALQNYDSLQQDYKQKFAQLTEQINFLTKQQILQQKMHAQLLEASLQKQNNTTHRGGFSQSEPTQNLTQEQRPPAPRYNNQPISPGAGSFRSGALDNFVENTSQDQPNIPKSWQDALAQLFQQQRELNGTGEQKPAPFNMETVARILEKTHKYQKV